MTQQLALARAFIGDPALLLLDEPTRSLDEAATDRMWAALERRPHVAMLIATHHAQDRARCTREIDPRG
jgi:ABC-type multidrug transport system ATPase subunit